jgi:hypothetical protein
MNFAQITKQCLEPVRDAFTRSGSPSIALAKTEAMITAALEAAAKGVVPVLSPPGPMDPPRNTYKPRTRQEPSNAKCEATDEGWVPLQDLRDGAVFETQEGVRAVKSEYTYPYGGILCVLLESGEYAHLYRGTPKSTDYTVGQRHNATLVREIEIPPTEPKNWGTVPGSPATNQADGSRNPTEKPHA